MAKTDELLKRYLDDDERYADLINGVSFGGRQIVKAEDLSERDTQTGYHKNTRAVKGKRNTKYRDLFRKASFGANFAVVGIENQQQVHYLMPVRCMEYDVKEYQRQEVEQKRALKKAAKEKGITGAEFLSEFPKEGRLHPCITIVLYYGDEWDGSADLHGLLDFTDIPEELCAMVNNYKLNLLDVKKLDKTDMFRTDLKQVLDAIRCAEDKEKLKELLRTDPAYKKLPEDAYDVIAAFTNSEDLVQIKEKNRGEEIDMCKALKEWAEEERCAGREEGTLANLRAIMANLNLTAEKAMDALNIPQEEWPQYLEKILTI